MYGDERRAAVELVAGACTLAQRVQDDIVATQGAVTKPDRSPVTVADLAIQVVISHRLRELYPDHSLLAEEEAETLSSQPELASSVLDLARLAVPGLTPFDLPTALDRNRATSSYRHWVLDPIDGTKGFLRGDQYAVALALVVDGEAVVGVLGCPNLRSDGDAESARRGSLFSAERGGGAMLHDLDGTALRSISVDGILDPSAAVVCESVEAAHAAHSDQAAIARRLGITREPVRIDSQCKYALVARGDASIYLRLPRRSDYREKAWDHAAGVVVIEQAGGRVSDLDGRPLDFSEGPFLARHHGIVATNRHLHDQVLEACRQVLGLEDRSARD